MFTDFGKFMSDGGFPIYAMIALLGFAVAVIYERVQALYYKYPIKTHEFMKQLKTLLMADKIEEAVAFCSAQKTALLPRVCKSILERADRDDENIRNAHDIATMDVIPEITKGLGYLAMIANVATLIGLLGTIHGLIISFQAVSFADPAQKQTLLAQGISMSMNLTAMGLMVAIPVMVLYSFLQSRQNKLIEEIVSQSAKVVDLLISRSYDGFDSKKIYTPEPKEAKEAHTKRKAG